MLCVPCRHAVRDVNMSKTHGLEAGPDPPLYFLADYLAIHQVNIPVHGVSVPTVRHAAGGADRGDEATQAVAATGLIPSAPR